MKCRNKLIMFIIMSLLCGGCSHNNPVPNTDEYLVTSSIHNNTSNDVLYKDNDVNVLKRGTLSQPIIIDNIWDMPTESELYNESALIANVTVKSIQEIQISYMLMGVECTTYKTLVTVVPNHIYYSEIENDGNENDGNEYIVAIPDSSYSHDELFPNIEVDDEYIFFMSDTYKLTDSLNLRNYADFYISDPADIVVIDGDECTVNSLFASYSNDAVPIGIDYYNEFSDEGINHAEKIMLVPENIIEAEKYCMPLSDFESELEAKISKMGE